MKLAYRVRAVERVFEALEKEIDEFKENSNLRCLPGCGKCCLKPDIDATVLEFLPFAYHLLRQGTIHSWYEKLTSGANDPICAILSPFLAQNGGFCSEYRYRGLICRLFGFSAFHNKYAEKKLSTFRVIKEQYGPEKMEEVQSKIDNGMPIPVIRAYYMKLEAIDQQLGVQRHPINKAIRLAIEEVLAYYSYRRPRFPRSA